MSRVETPLKFEQVMDQKIRVDEQFGDVRNTVSA
jgi:hypothetical protein